MLPSVLSAIGQIPAQPGVHFAIEKPAILGFQDPMVLLRENNQLARNAHSLKHAPVLKSLIKRDTKIVLTNSQQHWSARVFRKLDRVPVAPGRGALPMRPPAIRLTVINRIAGAPLRFEVDQAGVTDQTAITGGTRLHPV